MVRLVDDLLDISRITKGKLRLTKEQVDELLKDLLPSSSRLGRAAMQSAILKQIEEKAQKSSASG